MKTICDTRMPYAAFWIIIRMGIT